MTGEVERLVAHYLEGQPDQDRATLVVSRGIGRIAGG